MDCAGHLYVASGPSVVILDSLTGSAIATLAVAGVQSATNVAFGGVERKTLFITALGTGSNRGLLRVDLAFPGLPY